MILEEAALQRQKSTYGWQVMVLQQLEQESKEITSLLRQEAGAHADNSQRFKYIYIYIYMYIYVYIYIYVYLLSLMSLLSLFLLMLLLVLLIVML